jgi:hypothetical protein
MTEKSSLTASAAASKLDANVNFIQGPCRAAGINAFKAQCIPPAQLVVLIVITVLFACCPALFSGKMRHSR